MATTIGLLFLPTVEQQLSPAPPTRCSKVWQKVHYFAACVSYRNLLEPYVGLPLFVAIGVNLARIQNNSRGLRVSLPARAGRERSSWRRVDCGLNAVVAWSREETCTIENHCETAALAAET